jgi:hypothetical protein
MDGSPFSNLISNLPMESQWQYMACHGNEWLIICTGYIANVAQWRLV